MSESCTSLSNLWSRELCNSLAPCSPFPHPTWILVCSAHTHTDNTRISVLIDWVTCSALLVWVSYLNPLEVTYNDSSWVCVYVWKNHNTFLPQYLQRRITHIVSVTELEQRITFSNLVSFRISWVISTFNDELCFNLISIFPTQPNSEFKMKFYRKRLTCLARNYRKPVNDAT